MKKRVMFFLFSLLVVSNVWSQSQNRSLYVYRNDGLMNIFLNSQIDSITYSKVDKDSILRDDWTMQDVWTTKGLYRIPLTAIDSLSFVPAYQLITNINSYWNESFYNNNTSCLFFKSDKDTLKTIMGFLDDDIISMSFDDGGNINSLKTSLLALYFVHVEPQLFVYSTDVDNTVTCDTLEDGPVKIRKTKMMMDDTDVATKLKDMLKGQLTNVLMDFLKSKFTLAVKTTNAISPILKFIQLVDFLRDTDGMTAIELANYLESKTDIQSSLDKAEKESKEQKMKPTIYLGLITGDNFVCNSTSATCFVDGYLKAEANDSAFNFDFGICYSQNKVPTLKNSILKSNCNSNIVDNITLKTPQGFLLTGLTKGLKYYYRSFFRDNITGYICYGKVRSFVSDDAIDLGLSVKWASYNVGALKPEEFGGYYAWGETEEKSNYTEETYKVGSNNYIF